MKHFSLGLAVGAGFGMVLSLFEDKNGNRLAKPVQKQFSAVKDDVTSLTNAIADLKTAQQELKDATPIAKQGLTEVEKEIEYYQLSVSRIVDSLQQELDKLVQSTPKNKQF